MNGTIRQGFRLFLARRAALALTRQEQDRKAQQVERENHGRGHHRRVVAHVPGVRACDGEWSAMHPRPG